MKRRLALVLALAVLPASPALAIDLPGLPNLQGLPGVPSVPSAQASDDPAFAAVKASSTALTAKAQQSTLALLTGMASFHDATGNKAALADLQPLLVQLKAAKPDDTVTLKLVASKLQQLSASITSTTVTAHVPTLDERTKLQQAYASIGASLGVLASAKNDAISLGSAGAGVAAAAAANPMRLLALKDTLDTFQFLSSYVPEEATTAQSVALAVAKYATQIHLDLSAFSDISKAAGAAQPAAPTPAGQPAH